MVRAGRRGWGLVALDLGVDTTTPFGRLVASVMISVAEWERDTECSSCSSSSNYPPYGPTSARAAGFLSASVFTSSALGANGRRIVLAQYESCVSGLAYISRLNDEQTALAATGLSGTKLGHGQPPGCRRLMGAV